MAKILVACPTKVEIDAEAAMAMANLDRCGHDIDFTHADGRGVYGVAQARNRVADKAVDGNYDYLLTIDSDVIVPPNALSVLLDPPASIVLLPYRYKNGTGDSPFFKFERDANGNDKWKFDDIPDGRVAVKAAGMGCALIDTVVFRSLMKPWFFWVERETGRHTGEDIYFGDKARQAGFDILLDGRAKCRHVGRKVYG